MHIRATPGHLGDAVQANFFTQEVLDRDHSKELHHIGYTTYEKSIREKGLVPGGFDQNRGGQAVHFTLATRIRNQKLKAYKHLNSHHDAIYVGAYPGTTSSSSRLSAVASSAATRFQKNASKRVITFLANVGNAE